MSAKDAGGAFTRHMADKRAERRARRSTPETVPAPVREEATPRRATQEAHLALLREAVRVLQTAYVAGTVEEHGKWERQRVATIEAINKELESWVSPAPRVK